VVHCETWITAVLCERRTAHIAVYVERMMTSQRSRHSSDRYMGRAHCPTAIFNWTRRKVNQCSCRRIAVMWLRRRAPAVSRAASFWMDCIRMTS